MHMHVLFVNTTCVELFLGALVIHVIIESVDSISRDERDVPLTQYITNA